MRILSAILKLLGLLAGLTVTLKPALLEAQTYTKESGPELFTYEELVQLGSPDPMSPQLSEKLRVITTTPFISNEAYYGGAKPRPLDVPGLGPSLRVAFWNIERGLELDNILLFLKDKDAFVTEMTAERKKAKEEGKTVRGVDMEKIPHEIELLKAADIWILNEVDWGVHRTQHRNVVRELAEALDMNWAYGVEFLEVDAKQLGTDEFDDGEDAKERTELVDFFQVDKEKLKAMHGNAVLSRYPIRSARLVPFTLGYDWFKESKIRPLEKGKRKAAILVGEDLQREVRRGQRTTLYVDLDVPDAPTGHITVAATHLENRARPKYRRKQMDELLAQVHDIRNPVIVAGDLNTSGGDGTPTSLENMLYKQYGNLDFWTTTGVQWATGIGLIYTGSKALWKLSGIQVRVDPTSKNIPGISPNYERGLFKDVENYRFEDGYAFDFRGVPQGTADGTNSSLGTLGDADERAKRGFTPSFNTELIWGKVRVARFRLDWIFVKSGLDKPRDVKGPYRFEPHFAENLSDLNNVPPEAISDHNPLTVDLPFQEPAKANAEMHTGH